MDEEEKKEKKGLHQKVAGGAGTLVKLLKYIKNPIIVYLAFGLLILLLVIGVVGFFISLPSSTLGWIDRLITGNAYELKVSQKELIDLCKQLEEMQYDLEAYGFVEEIERVGETTYDSKSTEKATKGEIKSVKSKYLEAYIVAEKKSYVLANAEENPLKYSGLAGLLYSIGSSITGQSEYNGVINELAIEATIDKMWSSIWNDINSFAGSDETEAKDKVIEYIKYKKNGREKPDINDSLIKYLDGRVEEITNYLKVEISEFKKQYSKTDLLGTGLIYLEGTEETDIYKSAWTGNASWTSDDGRNYTVSIDKENKWIIISTSQSGAYARILDAIGLGQQNRYAYDLNGWTCKYGKTTEFLIAMHLATQAPEFAYNVATHPAIDTKVHVAMFPVTIDITLQTEEGEGGQTLSAFLESINTNEELLKTYKDKIKAVINKVGFSEEEKEELIKEATGSSTIKGLYDNMIKVTGQNFFTLFSWTINYGADTIKKFGDEYRAIWDEEIIHLELNEFNGKLSFHDVFDIGALAR